MFTANKYRHYFLLINKITIKKNNPRKLLLFVTKTITNKTVYEDKN
ncbi:hypothetical protein F5613_000301 [Macellibacteroides fermentans]|jgi:hypothetical protein|uniref:Uncharacterized protein n=1 Tax=Macellibacteroides fermentans TaxID=879969 RepID=A0A8E1ZX35_9PORP|nr:hypothetical protein [Macellibacteroides fermentans]